MKKIFPVQLETQRLLLVPPNEDAAKDVFSYSSDPMFCRYVDTEPPQSPQQSLAYIRQLIKDNTSHKRCYWMIHLKESHKVIGTMGFIFSYPQRHHVLEFGYCLSRALSR